MTDAPPTPDTPEPTTPEVSPDTKTPENTGFQWDGDFDPDRAAKLVTNLREENKNKSEALAAANAKLAEYEQAKMTELEKLAHRAETAEKERDDIKRSLMVNEIARKYGISDDLTQFISGSTPEEVEEKAKLLAERVQPAKPEPPAKPKVKPIPGSGGEVDHQTQLAHEDLKSMTPIEIEAARKAGRLDNLLKGR